MDEACSQKSNSGKPVLEVAYIKDAVPGPLEYDQAGLPMRDMVEVTIGRTGSTIQLTAKELLMLQDSLWKIIQLWAKRATA